MIKISAPYSSAPPAIDIEDAAVREAEVGVLPGHIKESLPP